MDERWMRGYSVEIQQLEDGDYLAWVVELGHSSCSFVGESILHTLVELERLLGEVLEVMEERGMFIPEPQGDPGEAPRCNLTSVSEQLYARENPGEPPEWLDEDAALHRAEVPHDDA